MKEASINPVIDSKRIEIVDALRGFALFGILLINITTFYAPGAPPGFAMSGSLLDRLVIYALIMLGESKFFTLFSFLFGLGFSIQSARAQIGETDFTKRFARRLLALGIFGIAHIVFVWEGDILLIYALVGFLLLSFRRASQQTLRKWILFLLIVPFILTTAGFTLISAARFAPAYSERLRAADTELFDQFAASRVEAVKKLSGGAYLELLPERVIGYQSSFFLLLTRVPTILAMFLLGIWAGRKNILQNVGENTELLRRVRIWGMLVGLSVSLLIIILYAVLPPVSALAFLFYDQTLAGPILSMGYAATFILVAQTHFGQRVFKSFSAVGKMSLTNYLAQSLICAFLFFGYGLALAGKITPLGGIFVTLIIFAFQIFFSLFWLRYFRFGPAEWIWRSITYSQIQALINR